MGDNIRLYFVLAFLFGLLAIGVFLYPGVPETGLGFFIKVLVIVSLGVYLWVVLQEFQVNIIASSQTQAQEPAVSDVEEEETVIITSVAEPQEQSANQDVSEAAGFDFTDQELNATKAYHRFQRLALDIITETLFCHSAMVYIADVPRNQLVLQDAQQPDDGVLVNRVDIGTDLLSQAFTEDEMVIKMMFQPSPDTPILYYQEPAPPIQSFLAVPIHYRKRVIGVLAVDHTARESFSTEDGQLLNNFARLISSAMVQFDVLDRLTEQRDLYAHLSQVNTKLSLSDNVEDLFAQSIRFSRNLFEYDSLVIILLQSQNSEQAEIATLDGSVLNYKHGYRFELKDSVLHEVITSGKSKKFADLSLEKNASRIIPELSDGMPEIRSLLLVPIQSHSDNYGAIVLGSKSHGKFTEGTQEILRILGSVVGASLNRFYLYRYMHSIASRDGLTNLYNYRAFKERLEEEIQRSKRYQTPFTLCIADLDKFKRINDTHGHLYGDFILKELARIIKSSVRSIDMVARYGGEEFAILLVNAAADDVLKTADRIREEVERHIFIKEDIREQITISIGLAEFPAHAPDADTLINHADEAMYQVKRGGGNSVRKYEGTTRVEEV